MVNLVAILPSVAIRYCAVVRSEHCVLPIREFFSEPDFQINSSFVRVTRMGSLTPSDIFAVL